MDEIEIINKLKKGDRGALEYLVRSTQDFLFNSLLQICHDRELAKDILADSYLLAFKYIKNFRGESTLTTWLYRIAVNELKKHFNKMKRVELRNDFETKEARQTSSSDKFNLLYEALSKLEMDEREIINLVDVQGISYEEVGEMLQIPIGTVKSRLARARDKLRGILEDMGYF
ncbi:MAG: sigma-70 family RNA polymerase sigma factor [Caldisericaceae bacterium]